MTAALKMGIVIVVLILVVFLSAKAGKPIGKVTRPVTKRITPGGSFFLLIIIVMALAALAGGHLWGRKRGRIRKRDSHDWASHLRTCLKSAGNVAVRA